MRAWQNSGLILAPDISRHRLYDLDTHGTKMLSLVNLRLYPRRSAATHQHFHLATLFGIETDGSFCANKAQS
jgi:hypothetical protein